MCKENVFIHSIEKRFCEVTGIDTDMSVERIYDENTQQKCDVLGRFPLTDAWWRVKGVLRA